LINEDFLQMKEKILGKTYAATNYLRRFLWKSVHRRRVEALEASIHSLSPQGRKSWYYYIDFGYGITVRPELQNDLHSGLNNWRNFLLKHLPDLNGKRVLDIGCNAGLFDLKMCEAGAYEVVGIDFDTQQAEFVREWFSNKSGHDYSNIRYIATDAKQFSFDELGYFDLVCMFRVAYHFGEGIEHIMGELSSITNVIALQGNTPRLDNPKYINRSHQHLAGTDGMQELLERYGFLNIRIVAPEGHPNPLVIGSKMV